MKECKQCGPQPLSEFYSYTSTVNGRTYYKGKCKECTSHEPEEKGVFVRELVLNVEVLHDPDGTMKPGAKFDAMGFKCDIGNMNYKKGARFNIESKDKRLVPTPGIYEIGDDYKLKNAQDLRQGH